MKSEVSYSCHLAQIAIRKAGYTLFAHAHSFGGSADCSGPVVWGKLSMASLCTQWLRNVHGGASLIGLNGVSVETVCSLDFAQGKLQVLGTWSKLLATSYLSLSVISRSLLPLCNLLFPVDS